MLVGRRLLSKPGPTANRQAQPEPVAVRGAEDAVDVLPWGALLQQAAESERNWLVQAGVQGANEFIDALIEQTFSEPPQGKAQFRSSSGDATGATSDADAAIDAAIDALA